MRYEYHSNADTSKKYRVKELSGLPKNLELKFDTFHIRIFKSREQPGYFSASIAIPSFKDDEGYVLEQNFYDPLQTKQLKATRIELSGYEPEFDVSENFLSDYEAQFNEHDLSSVTQSISITFEEKESEGERFSCLI